MWQYLLRVGEPKTNMVCLDLRIINTIWLPCNTGIVEAANTWEGVCEEAWAAGGSTVMVGDYEAPHFDEFRVLGSKSGAKIFSAVGAMGFSPGGILQR